MGARDFLRGSTVSFVIPALNEAENIQAVLTTIPVAALQDRGASAQIIVVDNGSTDNTAELARARGANVVHQPNRGYGNAYHAGFAQVAGDIVVTGDADCTYPFDAALSLIDVLAQRHLDFLNTNRLQPGNLHAMTRTHWYANRFLAATAKVLHRSPFVDSQSGMWVFRSAILPLLDIRSTGMGFSQEIKHEVVRLGLRCAEVPIDYRVRGGRKKLMPVRDGIGNCVQMVRHSARSGVPVDVRERRIQLPSVPVDVAGSQPQQFDKDRRAVALNLDAAPPDALKTAAPPPRTSA